MKYDGRGLSVDFNPCRHLLSFALSDDPTFPQLWGRVTDLPENRRSQWLFRRLVRSVGQGYLPK